MPDNLAPLWAILHSYVGSLAPAALDLWIAFLKNSKETKGNCSMGNERVPLHQQFWNTPILDQTSNHTPTTTKFDTLRSLSKPTGLPANGQRSGHKYWDVNDRVSTTKVFVEETLKLGHRVSAKFQSNCYDIGKMSCQFGSIYSLVDLPLTKKSPSTIPHDDTTIFFQISVLPSGNQNMACWKIRHFFLDDFSLQNLQFLGISQCHL